MYARTHTHTHHCQTLTMDQWDTHGQEMYNVFTDFQCRRANGIIIMYDITNQVRYIYDVGIILYSGIASKFDVIRLTLISGTN